MTLYITIYFNFTTQRSSVSSNLSLSPLDPHKTTAYRCEHMSPSAVVCLL